MHSKDRTLAALRGESADRPTLSLDGSGDFSIDRVDPHRVSLAAIANPFGAARESGEDLIAEFRRDPALSHLDVLADGVAKRIDDARSAGFDGVLYRVHGADPRHCSPMEYGGRFLELDRALLSRWPDGVHVTVVVAGEGAYLDFVSDLPGALFAWDSEATGVHDAAMRVLRHGALASADPRSNVAFACPTPLVDQLEKQTCGSL